MFKNKFSLTLTTLLSCLGLSGWVLASTAPPSTINTASLTAITAKHLVDYWHINVIGICFWLDHGKFGIPYVAQTFELDEYQPDLVVSSFNDEGDNPWIEVRESIDKASAVAGSAAAAKVTGFSLSNSNLESSYDTKQKGDGLLIKYVDVIGNPFPVTAFPGFSLKIDTTPLMPYYSSALDTPGRLGVAETASRLIESADLTHYMIGSSFYNKWGYEFPRTQSSNTTNDYKASVMAALRSADIVTNRNTFHVVSSTNDSCGTNCAVANVIEEMKDDHEIWEEVYPYDRHIQLGEDDSTLQPGTYLGKQDEDAGNGNYVFVIWRHYKGCVQHSGSLIYAFPEIDPTIKR